MLYINEPEGFSPSQEIVSCYVEYRDEILVLLRPPHKKQPNTWGLPAGKVEKALDETPETAMYRELMEETGIVPPAGSIAYLERVYVRYDEYDFSYHMFRLRLDSRPDVVINGNEHVNYRWVTPEAALGMDLIQDLDACIRRSYGL